MLLPMNAKDPVNGVTMPISSDFAGVGAGAVAGAGDEAGVAQATAAKATTVRDNATLSHIILIEAPPQKVSVYPSSVWILDELYNVRLAFPKLLFNLLVGKAEESLKGMELERIPLFVHVVELSTKCLVSTQL